MSIPLVMLDAGHGPMKPGASGNGVDEQALNWILCQKIAQHCGSERWAVLQTRQDYFRTPGLMERVQYTNSLGANLFVSIHLNAGIPRQHGPEVYHYGPSVKGAELAGIMAGRIEEDVPGRVRVIGSPSARYKKTLYVLKRTKPYALLIEACYVSNRRDAALVKTRIFPDAFCLAVADGIEACLVNLGLMEARP